LGAVSIAGVAFALASLADRGRRQLALRRLPTHDDPEQVTLMVPEIPVHLVPEAAVRRAAAAMSRPREGAVLDLDVQATIEETARAGGFFSPRFSARRSAREYVALVNRRGADDHQAAVFDGFLKQLRDRGIGLDAYSFHDDPRVCYSEETGKGSRLNEIVSRQQQATLLLCGDAHLAFGGSVRSRAHWVDSTAPFDRRVLWTPETPYRWSSMEQELIDAGFTVIPATEEGWRALVDLDNGWRQDALYPASYARPFPAVIGSNDRRWLDRNEPPPDIVERLLRQATDFLGPAGFRWMCACAVYPEISWGLTLRLAGDARDHSSLLSLARLPWFRHGFMPDWLRRLLVKRLLPEAGDSLRARLERLLEDLARTPRRPAKAARSALHIGRWMGAVKTIHLLRAAPEGSPLRDQVFLGFMARANVDPLSLKVPEPLRRLFRGRPGRFAPPPESHGRAVSLARQLSGRLRAWRVFHPGRLRLANAVAVGVLLLMVWRPQAPPVTQASTSISPAAPAAAGGPQPGTAASREGSAPEPAPVESLRAGQTTSQQAQTQLTPTPRTPTAPIPTQATPPGEAAAQQAAVQQPTEQLALQQPVLAPEPAAPPDTGTGRAAAPTNPPPNAADASAAGREGQPGIAATTPVQGPGGSSAPPDDRDLIGQLLQRYSAALESMNPTAVQDLYPSVDTRALATAFRDYQSLDQNITINRIDLASDGQRATVVALVATAPVVKTGRASPVSRTVTYNLRKQGDRWLIESAK
jgi:hypothetical protein